MAIVQIKACRCRMWALHDRLQDHILAESCKEEIKSFRAYGQLIPVLGRPVIGDPKLDAELIYGARRLYVARHLGKPISVDLREISDEEAIIAMDVENRQRSDISPYERGCSFADLIRQGYFRTQGELARALNISESSVSRYLTIARLPSVIVSAFRSPLDIKEDWGLRLSELLLDSDLRPKLIRVAREAQLVEERRSSDVYRRLISACEKLSGARLRARDEVIFDSSGRAAFRIRQRSAHVAILLPVNKLSEAKLLEVKRAIQTIVAPAQVETARQ